MKYTIAAIALFAASAEAFAPTPAFAPRRSSLPVLKARVDATELIKNAVAISEKFGKDSAEARLAWEAVEEVDSADNSVATKGSLDEECDVTQEWIDNACMEYSAKLEELDRLLQETKKATVFDSAAEDVKPIKLKDVPQQKPGKASPELQEAVENAKMLTDKYGIQSPEARVAWETVEEIASATERSDALEDEELSPEECLIDSALDACAALSELNRVIDNRPTKN
mmetsp:Transcript_118693/g.343307  ORF Transcript_118693/g.343307 Transcript_118693/m.343307 type:complete len:227 (+) Transcript_118693:92-772(+)|eukprot:CAMPEP_0176078220 /NCGR_PEP_ID=MMETSP0120_2-20121206/39116_1 /TAXON_ID=160619 /ORGANISM="Kryptoperidinium foliaceum, Strain CCMP 1326" /LENGTH=226 /DNA_ID=CAMNT_0017411965 /DNA_START=54 /DNA_END=734 /DNA_ORIENTATION=+